MSGPAVIGAAVLTAAAALTATWAVLAIREARRSAARARAVMAALRAVPGGTGGAHEACEMPVEEQLLWEAHFEGRYPSLGRDVTKGTSP